MGIVASHREIVRSAPIDDRYSAVGIVEYIKSAFRIAPNSKFRLSVAIIVVLDSQIGTSYAPCSLQKLCIAAFTDQPNQIRSRCRAFADNCNVSPAVLVVIAGHDQVS